MEKRKKTTPSTMIPDGEEPCVWMDAGVLSYKICDRDMDCENCPLDRALRGDGGTRPSVSNVSGEVRLSPLVERLSRFSVDTARYYHPGHTWVRIESGNRVCVGLDPLLASVLGELDAVALQKAGENVVRSSAFGEITQGGRCFPVFSPVSGRVRKVNREAVRAPAMVVFSPLETGWLLLVEPSNLEQDLACCRTGSNVLSWMLGSLAQVNAYLAPEAGGAREALGRTLFDGGEIYGGLREVLPPDRYRKLVLDLLGRGEARDLAP
jgi:glycine cleavage system H protein